MLYFAHSLSSPLPHNGYNPQILIRETLINNRVGPDIRDIR